MTSTFDPPPRASAFARGRRNFRRWRRGRPFWGGLFLILAGIELIYSSNMDLGGLQVHFGYTGFLSYLLPGILLLVGVLLFVLPGKRLYFGQRIFFSVIAALTSVFTLIGLNLGGFFLGMILGMTGSALAFAWSPVIPVSPTTATPEDTDPGAGSTDDQAVGDWEARWGRSDEYDEQSAGRLSDVAPGGSAYRDQSRGLDAEGS